MNRNEMNRDLLLLNRSNDLSPEQIEYEVARLNTLLYHAESWESFCVANEILDVSRHKVIRKSIQIEKLLLTKKNRPFIFVCNKN